MCVPYGGSIGSQETTKDHIQEENAKLRRDTAYLLSAPHFTAFLLITFLLALNKNHLFLALALDTTMITSEMNIKQMGNKTVIDGSGCG